MKNLAIAGLTALVVGACNDATGPAAATSLSPEIATVATSYSTTAELSNTLVVQGSPVTYEVNFGFGFSSISQVDYFFNFGNDPLDAGECLIFRVGFCNPGPAPQYSRLLTIPCSNDPVECDFFQDGVDVRTMTAEWWFSPNGPASVRVMTLSVTVHGTIASPVSRVQGIVGQVDRLAIAAILPQGQANSLRRKLLAAIDMLTSGKTQPAANLLNAFSHEVAALMAGHNPVLIAEQGQPLIEAANAVIAALETP